MKSAAESPTLVRNNREDALILASALAYAVGRLDGMEVDAGFAGQVLEWWRYPQRIVKAKDVDAL